MTKMANPTAIAGPNKIPYSTGQVLGSPSVVSGAALSPVVPANVPPTGLIGSEQALLGGLSGYEGALLGGSAGSEHALIGGQSLALDAINRGNADAQKYLQSAAGVGFSSPESIGQASYNSNIGAKQYEQGVSALNPYAAGGENAAKLQADLTGANGPEAQRAAYAAYQSSPAMQYQMDQMQKATERSAAARGGLLGGNVLQELQRNASGIASQDYQNQFNNLGQVTGTGLAAAGQKGQLLSNQAQMLGSLEGQRMTAQAGLDATKFQGELSARQHSAQLKSDAYSQLANIAAANGLSTAGLFTGTAQQLAQGRTNTGQDLAQGRLQTGLSLSQGRTQAGQSIAQNANQAASNISNLLAQNGIAVSDMMAKDISTVTDMIYQSGMQDKIDSQQLAAILANISGGQQSTVANGNSNIGASNAAGTLGTNSAIQGALQQAIASGVLGGGK